MVLNFLFRYFALADAASEREQAREMGIHTLRAMAQGGIYDHLGGGFHRYSVDAFWHVPQYAPYDLMSPTYADVILR